jgi:hypothetical protein
VIYPLLRGDSSQSSLDEVVGALVVIVAVGALVFFLMYLRLSRRIARRNDQTR